MNNLEEYMNPTSDGRIKVSRQILVIMNKSHDAGINPEHCGSVSILRKSN